MCFSFFSELPRINESKFQAILSRCEDLAFVAVKRNVKKKNWKLYKSSFLCISLIHVEGTQALFCSVTDITIWEGPLRPFPWGRNGQCCTYCENMPQGRRCGTTSSSARVISVPSGVPAGILVRIQPVVISLLSPTSFLRVPRAGNFPIFFLIIFVTFITPIYFYAAKNLKCSNFM